MNNQECSLQLLTNDVLQGVRLQFTSFNTESFSDEVRVYDGSDATAPLLYTFSGTSRPSDVFSSGSTVFVSFVTDGSNTADGFNIVYSTITPGKSQRLYEFMNTEYIVVKQRYLTLSVKLMLSQASTIDHYT